MTRRAGLERLIADLIPVLRWIRPGFSRRTTIRVRRYRKGMMLIASNSGMPSRVRRERIEAAGKIFDPHFHQPIERAESKDHPDGFILHVSKTGTYSTGVSCGPRLYVSSSTQREHESGKFEIGGPAKFTDESKTGLL